MKKILLCGSLLVASAILVSACSGGDDDDDGAGGTLTNGAYAYTGGLTTNTCNFDPAASFYGDGGTADVTVTGTTVSVDLGGGAFDYTQSGASLQDDANSGSQTIACTGTGAGGVYNCGSRSYACSITADFDFGGQVTGNDAFTLEDSYSYSGTGADCAIVATSAFGAGTTFPCTTVDAGDFAK